MKKVFSNKANSEEDIPTPTGDKYLDYAERSISLSQITIPIDEEIKEPAYYRRVINRISDLGENDEVRFLINSPGGRLDALVGLLDAVRSTPATTVAVLTGEAHSAASILALSCDSIHVSDYSTMLVHNVSFGVGGKGADVRDHVKHTLDFSEKVFRDTYTGFLTEEEMLAILDGKEMWLQGEDIGLRLEKRMEYLKSLEVQPSSDEEPVIE